VQKIFCWTDPEAALKEEVLYWGARSAAERVAAVELLREQTAGIYGDHPARLERVHRFVERAPRPLSRGRRTRSGRCTTLIEEMQEATPRARSTKRRAAKRKPR
jgi:hypothetical protein